MSMTKRKRTSLQITRSNILDLIDRDRFDFRRDAVLAAEVERLLRDDRFGKARTPPRRPGWARSGPEIYKRQRDLASALDPEADTSRQQRTLPEAALWVQVAPVHFEKAQLSAVAQSTRLPMGDRRRAHFCFHPLHPPRLAFTHWRNLLIPLPNQAL
jgi:hypothetical protein